MFKQWGKKKYKEEQVENVKAKSKRVEDRMKQEKVYKGETHRIIIKYDKFGSLLLGYWHLILALSIYNWSITHWSLIILEIMNIYIEVIIPKLQKCITRGWNTRWPIAHMMNIVCNLKKEHDEDYPCKRPKPKNVK
jgi:hypothetical protein